MFLLLLIPILLAQAPDFDHIEKLLSAGRHQQARTLLSSLHCPPSPLDCQARSANLSGRIHLLEGSYPAAAEAFHQSLLLYRSLRDTPKIVNTLNNLGAVQFYLGDYAAAYAHYLAAARELEGAQHQPWHNASLQLTIANIATLQQRLGRYRQALESYHSLGQSPTGFSPAERAQLLANLAVLNRRLGDPWKTRTLLQQSLQILESAMDRDTWLGVVKNLGIVEALDFGNLPAAKGHFERSLLAAERTANAREAMQARLYLAETHWRAREYPLALTLWRRTLAESRSLHTPEDEWRSHFGIARSLRRLNRIPEARQSLADSIRIIEAMRGAISAPTLRTEFLSDKDDVYEEAIDFAIENSDHAAIFRAMERARALSLKEGLHLRDPSLPQLQSRLRPGEAALLFRTGKARSFSLWITKDQVRARRLPLTETAASSAIGEIRRGMGASLSQAATLATILLPPDVPARRLWIVPDGVLSFLPFELLPHRRRPLLDTVEIVYLPFAGFLRSTAPPSSTIRWPWQLQLYAYANPDIQRAQLLPGDDRWAALPHSAAEAQSIMGLLPGASILRQGAALPPSAILQEAAQSPILHFATHAAGDPENPNRNRLLLGNNYLYASNLSPNQLNNVRLAVLSACDTDYGTLSRGEGVHSLARSFLLAGAHATVASLWRVDDAATRLFMEQFYRGMRSGLDAAAAIRQAKLRFASSNGKLRDPRFWAPFVLQGAGDETLPTVIRWWQLFAAPAALLLAAFYLNTRRKPR